MWTKTFSPTMFFLLVLALGGLCSANAQAVTWYQSNCQARYDQVFGSIESLAADYCKGYSGSPDGTCTTSLAFTGPGEAVNPWFHSSSGKVFSMCRGISAVNGSTSTIGEFVVGRVATGSACPPPLVESGGLCTEPVPCPDAGTPAIPSGKIGYGETAEGSNPLNAVLCDMNQCGIAIDHATAIPIGGGLQGVYIHQARYTGEQVLGVCPLFVTAASPSDPTLPKPIDTVTPAADTPSGQPVLPTDCPAGSAFGTVNGVNVCAPSGSKIAYQPDTSTQTNNGITTTSSTQRTDTVNPDGSVTTNKTTISTGAGGATSTTNTTTNITNNTFGGGTSKEGDSINIDLGPAPSAESGDVPAIPGIAPGTGQDGSGQGERTFKVGTHFSGSGACIADRSVQAMGITVTVPLSQLCPWFDIMYKVVSLVAVFAALRILVMA